MSVKPPPASSLLPDGHACTRQSLSILFSPYFREFKRKVKWFSFPCYPGRKIFALTSLPTAELGLLGGSVVRFAWWE